MECGNNGGRRPRKRIGDWRTVFGKYKQQT